MPENSWELQSSPAVYRYYWVKVVWDRDQPDSGTRLGILAQSSVPVYQEGGGPEVLSKFPIVGSLAFVLNDRKGPAPVSLSAWTIPLVQDETPNRATTIGDARAWIDTNEGNTWKADALHWELMALRVA